MYVHVYDPEREPVLDKMSNRNRLQIFRFRNPDRNLHDSSKLNCVSSALEGFNIKQGMIKEAQAMQQERIAQIAEKEKRKTELEALKQVKQKEKEDAEAPEKEALGYYRQLEEEERKKKVRCSWSKLMLVLGPYRISSLPALRKMIFSLCHNT
jgi:vacuolar-type H+-ATPase subunit I/STV1